MYNHLQNVGGNIESTGHSDESQIKMRSRLLDNMEGNLCYKVAKKLAELFVIQSIVKGMM